MKKKKRSKLVYSTRVVEKNGVGLDVQEEWLRGLGEFEFIRPPEAATLWGVTVREAMSRLHSLIGNFLEISPGSVEVYQRVFPEKPIEKEDPQPCSACATQLAKCKGLCMTCYMRLRYRNEKGRED